MESEEDEISLIVEGGDLPTNKLRVMWKEGGEQTTNSVTKAGGEVVQDHLWSVLCRLLATPLQ